MERIKYSLTRKKIKQDLEDELLDSYPVRNFLSFIPDDKEKNFTALKIFKIKSEYKNFLSFLKTCDYVASSTIENALIDIFHNKEEDLLLRIVCEEKEPFYVAGFSISKNKNFYKN